MSTRMLASRFRGVAEALLPDAVLVQERSVAGVVNADATVRPDALTEALPWQRVDVVLPGEPTVSGAAFRLAFPQGGRIRHLAISARIGPAGGAFTLVVTTSSGGSEAISMQAGETRRMTGVSLAVDPGSWVTGAVTATAGVTDVLISLHYTGGA